MTREEQIEEFIKFHAHKFSVRNGYETIKELMLEMARWCDNNPKNPWITDRMPEIKGMISDAVVLLIDGMFYRVSRLERRKDGTEFWWGVHPEDGEEVDAWMPIPEFYRRRNEI